MKKAIPVAIFENKRIGNCSNHGISSRYSEILLLHERGFIEVDEDNPPENLCEVVEQKTSFGLNRFVRPVKRTASGCVGYMFGGSLVYSSDARFGELSDAPLRLHDRQETQELYDSMFND